MKKIILSAAVIVAGASSVAQASDLIPAGLYFRVDTGYSLSSGASLKDNAGSGAGCTTCDGSIQNNIGDSPLIGVGVGYRISPLFRTDLTVTYRGGYKLSDTDNYAGPLNADMESLATMINGYVDIPVNFGPIKPYVGAGVGWAHNTTGKLSYTYASVGDVPGGFMSAPSNTADNVAWQVMAGTGIELTGALTLDIGYRYFDGGTVRVGKGVATDSTVGVYTAAGLSGHLQAHEVTAGLRFGF